MGRERGRAGDVGKAGIGEGDKEKGRWELRRESKGREGRETVPILISKTPRLMDTTAPERLVVMSVCRRWDAGVSRAIRSPAAGSPLPVAELSASERRRHPLDVRSWTAGLSICSRRNAAVSRCHLVIPSAALRQLLFNFSYPSFP